MDVAIIGGGFSGTLLATQLLHQPTFTGRIFWFERHPPFAQGIAYGTSCQAHLLNVPARNMSAFPDRAGHFVDWLQTNVPSGDTDRTELGDTFVPRTTYARYLAHIADTTAKAAQGRLQRITAEVTDVRALPSGRQSVCLRDHASLQADAVALCVGHFTPKAPKVAGAAHLHAPAYVNDPWAAGALAHVPRNGVVATLGAGLTMVDVVLALAAQGFAGQLTAVSRRGLWPRSHVRQPSPIARPAPPQGALLGAPALLRWLRAEMDAHAARGGDWRQVLDALRPHTVPTWQALSLSAQASLLRHGKASWDAHRHRVAPQVGQQLATLRHRGLLHHHAGRLLDVTPRPSKRLPGLVLHWRLRQQSQPWRQEVDALINCTGVHNDWRRATSALALALQAAGRVTPGPHGMGLALTEAGACIGGDGQVQPRLWAMGPARLGQDFESVAVPELRAQAAALAEQLARRNVGFASTV